MSDVLTLASSVTCQFQGTVATSSSAKLTVQGQAVLLIASVAGAAISGCQHPSSSSSSPCVTVAAVTGTPSTVLTAGNAGVLTAVVGTGTSTPTPDTLSAVAQQALLTAS